MLTTGKGNITKVNITQWVSVPDGAGGFVDTWAAIYFNITCRFNALPKREEIIAYNKTTVFANQYVYLMYLSAIKEGDRLIKTDDSREFEVKLIQDWDEDRNYMKLAVLEVGRNE